jgi:molecular chaperone DnaK
MVADAASHAADDQNRRESVDTRNAADSLVYQARKTMSDLGEKIESTQKEELETKIAAVETALAGQDLAAMKSSAEALAKTLSAVGQKAYESAAGADEAGAQANGGGQSAGGDGAVEADFEVVDEDK